MRKRIFKPIGDKLSQYKDLRGILEKLARRNFGTDFLRSERIIIYKISIRRISEIRACALLHTYRYMNVSQRYKPSNKSSRKN
jgi:hypothetical protein